MTAALRIRSPGLLTTLQDLGRPGYQSLGVAVSGALDPMSLRAANALVQNSAGEGALEMAYVGASFVVEADSVHCACVGGEATIEIVPAQEDGTIRRVPMRQSFHARRGETVRIGAIAQSAVAYLAVAGGFAIEPVLGSKSTFVRGRIGGSQGRPLQRDDVLPLTREGATDGVDYRLDGMDLGRKLRFRAIIGPQQDYFSDEAIATLFENEYAVASGTDRMAMPLTGPKLSHRSDFNIVSDGIAPGSIQVPGSGAPIVLLADRQTTGGYPKIATVISADLAALGRVRIGDRISFQAVTMDEARAARRQMINDIERLPQRVVPIRARPTDLAAHLFGTNLISGAISAHDEA